MNYCICFIFCLFSIFNACAQEESFEKMLANLYKNTVPLIKSEELAKKIAQKSPNLIILDAREKTEYKTSHLPNAVFIGYDQLNNSYLEKLDKNAEVIVYCSVGYRSERVGEKLQKLGVKKVSNLYGGIFDWANKGNAVYTQNPKTTKTEPTKIIHGYNRKWSKWVQKPNTAIW